MSDKEIIRYAMQSNLELPTKMLPQQAVSVRPSRASVRISLIGRVAVFAALAVIIGAAGFVIFGSSNDTKPERSEPAVAAHDPSSSQSSTLKPAVQPKQDSSKDTQSEFDKASKELIDMLVNKSEQFFAETHILNTDASQQNKYIQQNFWQAESRGSGAVSRTAKAFGLYLQKVKAMKPEEYATASRVCSTQNLCGLTITTKQECGYSSFWYTEYNGRCYVDINQPDNPGTQHSCSYSFDVPQGTSSFFTQCGNKIPLDCETDHSISTIYVPTEQFNNTFCELVSVKDARYGVSVSFRVFNQGDDPYITIAGIDVPSGVKIDGGNMLLSITPSLENTYNNKFNGNTKKYSVDFNKPEPKYLIDKGKICSGFVIDFDFTVLNESPDGSGIKDKTNVKIESYYGTNPNTLITERSDWGWGKQSKK